MIEFYSQRDPAWRGRIMTTANRSTDPKGRAWVDTLGVYGCLVTSLANVITATIKDTTPGDLNEVIRAEKGYNYLADPMTDEKNASFLIWPVFEKLFPIYDILLQSAEYIEDPSRYYIARIVMQGSGHYINVLKELPGGRLLVFDVWDGRVRIIPKTEVTFYHRVRVK